MIVLEWYYVASGAFSIYKVTHHRSLNEKIFMHSGEMINRHDLLMVCFSPGLVPSTILVCSLFTIKDQCKKAYPLHTHNQGSHKSFLMVTLFSVVLKETHELRLRSIEGRHISTKSLSRVRDRDEGVA